MISILMEATLRSLLVGLVVAVGLRAFKIRNVVAQKAAWGLVLVAALVMPLLVPVSARWQLLPANASIVLPAHPMTLLEELRAKIEAKSTSGRMPAPGSWSAPPVKAVQGEKSASGAAKTQHATGFQPGPARTQRPLATAEPMTYPAGRDENTQSSPQTSRFTPSPSALGLFLYAGAAAVLLVRLLLGLGATLRLWFTAAPIPSHKVSYCAAALPLRASSRVSSPLTIGSAILLPADYDSWDRDKLRVVLAHERSHIRQGDFYLQLLASLYASLFWFSPLGWWVKRELADLAEAISDRAGIEEAESRTSYAQILLEFAAAPRPAAIGVAMARSGSLSRRIERLLDDRKFRQSFAGHRRAFAVVVLVPFALFAATAMVRVQAASTAQPSSKILVLPAARLASSEPALAPLPGRADRTTQQVELIGSNTVVAVSAGPAASPELEVSAATTPEVAAVAAAPSLFRVAATAPAIVAEQESNDSLSFDRTLSASGETQLMVSTGSGNIHLTRGSGSQIRIHGQIHVSREGSEEQARQIAANPPIEQAGNVIRVGQQHEEHWHGISIDYEIEAPAGTLLGATSGSGNIVDEGVGQNAKLETGSGDINASALQGPFTVKTGSGNITAEQTGQGDVRAETGSGNIEIKDVHGSFRGQTGSGDIKATGTPTAPWTLETGSGNIEIWSGNAPLTLDGSTGSGSVTTDHEMLVQGSFNQHHITGKLNGGGPLVRVQTGSGDIHVH